MNAKQLREWRKGHGLTQEKLAALLGVDPRTCWLYENGGNIPKTVELACEALDQRAIMDQLRAALDGRLKTEA